MALGRRRGAPSAQWTTLPLHPLVFTPDLAPNTPGAVSDAKGLIPTAKGLRVANTLQVVATGIDEPSHGSFVANFPNGASYVYVGTEHHLWANTGGTFLENDNGQTFNADSEFWTFAQVGNYVIAANPLVNHIQAVTSPGGQFSNLAGSPPQAAIASSADPGGTGFFAFLFNLQSNPQGWACSGAGQPNSWPLDTTNLSATGTLGLTQGAITAATPLRGGSVAFKKNSFYYGQFIGAPYIWQFQLVSPSQGVAGPYAFANAGDTVYFIGVDNIYAFDGFSLQIVPNKLAEWLIRTQLDANFAQNIIGSYDSSLDLVTFRFPSINADPAGSLDMKIMWNRKSGRWLLDHEEVQGAVQYNLPTRTGTTYGQMTTTYATYGQIIAGTTYGVLANSSSATTAGAVFLGNDMYVYSGVPRLLDTYFVTTDIGTDTRETTLFRSRLLWSLYPSSATIQMLGYGKDFEGTSNPNDIFLTTGPTAMGPRGFFDFRQTARWNNLKFLLNNASEITGYAVMAGDGGWR